MSIHRDHDSGHPRLSMSSLAGSARSNHTHNTSTSRHSHHSSDPRSSLASSDISSTSATFACKPPSAPFFSPTLRRSRHRSYLRWLLTTSFLCAMILALLSIYWGGLTSVDKKLGSLTVLVVDYDTGGLVGPVVRRLASEGGLRPLSAVVKQPETKGEAEKEEEREVRRIYNEEHWLGLIVRSNATMVVREAVGEGGEYDQRAGVWAVYVGARQETVLNSCG